MILCQMGFPLDIDALKNNDILACTYTEINEPALVDSLNQQFNQTSLAKNFYLKEAASKLIEIGNQGYERVNNYYNI